ncbi:hypothetical protein PQX77_000570 [Marasmius sp. AFHP31]|nr:hypothetical protein PQX77_000570 [Marasmius sp. AFHP31]
MRSFSILSLLVATLVSSAVATPGRTHISVGHHQHQRRANKLAKRIPHSDDAVWDIEKRQADGARFTYYKTGLGACGGYNGDNDYIVALNEYQWEGGKHCGQQITIEVNGKTSQATIVDLCPFDSCPFGALDMSHGLFSNWGSPEQLGVITGRWWYGSGGGGGQQPTTTRHEEPTTTPPPPPPSTTSTSSTPPPPPPTTSSTTSTTSSSTSTTSSSSSSSSSTSSSSSSTASSSSESATSTSSTQQALATGNVHELNKYVGGVGGFLYACSKLQA